MVTYSSCRSGLGSFAWHKALTCWEAGYREVKCYSDSLNTVRQVKEGVPVHHQEANEIFTIREFLTRDWRFGRLEHVFREGNHCADYLAKLGASSDTSLLVLQAAPQGMEALLRADAMGIAYPRS